MQKSQPKTHHGGTTQRSHNQKLLPLNTLSTLKTKTSPLMTQMRLINTDKPNSKRKENLREKRRNSKLVIQPGRANNQNLSTAEDAEGAEESLGKSC